MTDRLKITKTEGNVPILHFEGDLDAQTEKFAEEYVQSIKDEGARYILIDLANVEIIASAGLRALHSIYKMFTPADEIQAWKDQYPGDVYKSPYFKLAQPSPQVHYVLSIAGFLQGIYIFPTLSEAVDSFSVK